MVRYAVRGRYAVWCWVLDVGFFVDEQVATWPAKTVLMPDFNFVPSGEHNRTKWEQELCLVSSAASIKVAIGSKKVAPHGAGHSRLESRKTPDCRASMRPLGARPNRDPDTSPRAVGGTQRRYAPKRNSPDEVVVLGKLAL